VLLAALVPVALALPEPLVASSPVVGVPTPVSLADSLPLVLPDPVLADPVLSPGVPPHAARPLQMRPSEIVRTR